MAGTRDRLRPLRNKQPGDEMTARMSDEAFEGMVRDLDWDNNDYDGLLVDEARRARESEAEALAEVERLRAWVGALLEHVPPAMRGALEGGAGR